MSDVNRGRIEITLQADLCAGSGYSFAGIVDSDVCHDDCGLPYIPAKRIKGCIREALTQNLYAVYPETWAERLFGAAGDKVPGAVTIGNARIGEYAAWHAYLAAGAKDPQSNVFYQTQQILDRFTHVRGQTRIDDNGVAEDNTLRYTRVVNRTHPGTGNPMVFYADITCPDDAELKAVLEDAVKATHHIGLKRNRGLGAVHCRCIWDTEAAAGQGGATELLRQRTENGKTVFSVCLKNTAPLMLSKRTEDTSEHFISGQSLRGALAARYLASGGERTAESEAFRALFLDGQTIYTNLYPADETKVYFPAPEYINRLKKTKKYVNTIGAEWLTDPAQWENDDAYDPGRGNQPKKLKGKFAAIRGNTVALHETQSDMVYHHSRHKKGSDGEEGILYGMEVLREGQTFAGEVIVPEAYTELMKDLLTQGDFYFGKSRSSQYGRCVSVQAPDTARETQIPEAGKPIVVTFLSDTILLNRHGAYTVAYDEVVPAVAEQLGIEAEVSEGYVSMLQTTTVTGHSAIWNLRRDAVPAVRAGSCLVLQPKAGQSCEKTDAFIGERCTEGYGQIRIDSAEAMTYRLEEETVTKCGQPLPDAKPEGYREMMADVLCASWLENRRYDALTGDRIRVSATALGRITLMLRESLDAYRGNTEGALTDFKNRIDSIKTDSVRDEANKVLSMVARRKGNAWSWRFGNADDGSAEVAELKRLHYSDAEIETMLRAQWGVYLMTTLVEYKYQGGM